MNIYTWPERYVLLRRVMKISFIQLILTLALTSLSYAHTALGQAVLERDVTLSFSHVKLEKVLQQLEKSGDIKFAYSSRVVNDQQLVSVEVKNEKLGVVLRKLLSPLGISFEFIGGRISLFPANTSELKPDDTAPPRTVNVTVSGTVTDDLGEALPGVNVLEKGTSNGTTTDANGAFSVSVSENATLVFSFIGYTTQDVALDNRTTLAVRMMPDVQSLNEVVVVGYGTQEKKDLTGSVSSVTSDILANRQSVQVSDALQGTMAGVTVTRTDGQPGGGSTVRIRGVTSLNVNDPLVIVDGVPGLGINDVNPNDVESLTVLKDAASQAIYGARAAAGVILITTKRGKEGKLQLNYDYEYGVSRPTELPTFVGAKTYRNMINERSTNDGGGKIYDQAINDQYDELHATNPDLYPDTDWQGLTLSKKTTNRQRHDLSMTVGTDKVKTRASLSYVSEDGLYANKKYDRYTFRVNNNLKMFKWLEANIDLYYKQTNSLDPSLAGTDNVMRLARLYPNVYSAIRTDNLWGEGKDGENNLAVTQQGGTLDQKYKQLSGIIGVTITPLEGLTIKGNFSPTYNFNKYDLFVTPPLIPRQGSTTQFWPQKPTGLDKRETDITTLTRQVTINYSKKFKDHHLDVLAGYEEIGTAYEEVRTASNNLVVNLPSLTFGDPSLTTNNLFASENALRSYFGRLSYDYKGRYLLQSNLRADGSSRFAPENRWGLFPSLSLGWVVSNESFALPAFISYLKARVSYGEVGNERIGEERTDGNEFFNFYPYQSLYERSNVIFYDGAAFTPRTGIRQDFLADQSIVWETTRTVDGGIDIGLFNDKFLLSLDYYRKNTDNIILTLDLPNYLGYQDDTKTNVGSMRVTGLDLEATYKNSIGDLTYSVSGNVSSVASEVTDVGGRNDFTTEGGTKINIKGSEFNEWYGYQTRGIYQTVEEANNYGVKASAGDVWIVDQLTEDTNNDGVPDAGDKIINERDRVPLGASLPKFTYGGNINLQYKGFDLSVVFNGVGQHTRRYDGFQVTPFGENFGNAPSVLEGNYWSLTNTPEQNLQAKYPRLSSKSEVNNNAVSDFWLFNGSYFRVKNITLGYTLPASAIARIKLTQLRFYVGLRDYFTVQRNFLPGWDPEASNTGYPIMKSVLFGVNVKL
ncbi:TonB-dependent receptor [Chryseolinea lacunae]|uniref:TonB-dependent receptor n=1 Tax=Chryseolinea lacunae TaxID=2801331 RepID=A0ABS1KPF8_9BACT|nr:TonB-dependent receptor [Chryseolinea lacunae]MBL0740587.1 TonB-dependent receptor [Chryseolinea lacunae]